MNVLSMDAVYVDTVEDALWIRMELMDRSLADVIGLEGLKVEEGVMGQVAADVRFPFFLCLSFSSPLGVFLSCFTDAGTGLGGFGVPAKSRDCA